VTGRVGRAFRPLIDSQARSCRVYAQQATVLGLLAVGVLVYSTFVASSWATVILSWLFSCASGNRTWLAYDAWRQEHVLTAFAQELDDYDQRRQPPP
jgi:hypothetical protein